MRHVLYYPPSPVAHHISLTDEEVRVMEVLPPSGEGQPRSLIMEKLAADASPRTAPNDGNLHTRLVRMENKGVVQSYYRESNGFPGRPPRVWLLTATGRHLLAEERKEAQHRRGIVRDAQPTRAAPK